MLLYSSSRNDSADNRRSLQKTLCGVPKAFLDPESVDEFDYADLVREAGPICEYGYITEDGSTQPLADCLSESGAVPDEYASTAAGEICGIALCVDARKKTEYCCFYQQMCISYGDSTAPEHLAICDLAACCYENKGSTENCFGGSYPTTYMPTTTSMMTTTEATTNAEAAATTTANAEATASAAEATTTNAEATASAAEATTTSVASGGTTIAPTTDETTATLAPGIEEPNAPSASSHIKAVTCVMGVAIAVISFWM